LLGIEDAEKILRKKEKDLDVVHVESRKVVRTCSNAIKAIHAYDLKAAKKYMKEADAEVKKLLKYQENFPSQIGHIMQEYTEAKIVLRVVDKRDLPEFDELSRLGVSPVSYLNGLLDATGEIKREMYESLRRGNKNEAKAYFKMMEKIYDSLIPIRFSNAVLPEFKRKQDVARIQIEQARGELLRHEN